jgi:hypothetical protein
MHHGPWTTLPISASVGQLFNQELTIVVHCLLDQVAVVQHLVS